MKKKLAAGLVIVASAFVLTGCAAETPAPPVSAPAPIVEVPETINLGDTISIGIFDSPTFWRATSSNPEVVTVKNAYITEDGTHVVPSVQSVAVGTSTVKLQSILSGKTIEFDVTVK